MPEIPTQPPPDSVISVQLGFILTTVNEIKSAQSQMDCKLDNFQLQYTAAHEQLGGKVDSALQHQKVQDKEIEDLENSIKALAKEIAPVLVAYKVLMVIASIVLAADIGLVVGLLTHTIHIP